MKRGDALPNIGQRVMREDQIEAIERLQQDYFPNGIVVLAPMADGSLHAYLHPSDDDGEYLHILDHLSEMAIKETERLQRKAKEQDNGNHV